MVKAIKRQPGKAIAGPREKKKSILTSKFIVLLFIVLFAGGWMIGGYFSFKEDGKPQDAQGASQQPEYGIGNLTGSEAGAIGQKSGNLAVYGQLEVPPSLKVRLDGDLYYLDNGASQLILTNKTRDEVASTIAGSYILYDVASCGAFDCLLDNETDWANVTAPSFDVYNLNMTSKFLTTSRVGLPPQ